MTIPFSLSSKLQAQFGMEIEREDGSSVPIDPDFRTVLKCLRIFNDPDASDRDKVYMLCRCFYKGAYIPDAVTLFVEYISTDEEPDGEPPAMDFEQDADAIYSSFMSQYKMDLVDIPFLHWRKFRALMSGLGEGTELQSRITLRKLDTSKMKGDDKIKADKAKRRVALKERMSAEEQELQKKLDEALAAGDNPSAALSALQAYYERR